MNRYTHNNSKGYVLEGDLEYPKELRELHNDYPLAPDKIEMKGEMLPDYQLKIANLNNIPIVTDKEKYVRYYENLQLHLRLGLKLKKYIAY